MSVPSNAPAPSHRPRRRRRALLLTAALALTGAAVTHGLAGGPAEDRVTTSTSGATPAAGSVDEVASASMDDTKRATMEVASTSSAAQPALQPLASGEGRKAGLDTMSADSSRGRPTATTTSTTTTTTPPTPSDPCGETVLKTDGPPWECTFADSFDGSSLDRSKWYVHETDVDGYHSGQECMVDDPDNVFVGDGALTLRVTEEDGSFTCGQGTNAHSTRYTSGTVSTINSHSQTYGRVEVRAKAEGATAPGLQSALWMWPKDAWTTGTMGEIDIAEMYSQYPDRAIPTVHRWLPAGQYISNYWCLLDASEFHDYVLEWTEERLRISYDGQLCLDYRIPAGSGHFDQPYYTVLTQALGLGTNAFDPGSTPLPAATVIDHVRIWR